MIKPVTYGDLLPLFDVHNGPNTLGMTKATCCCSLLVVVTVCLAAVVHPRDGLKHGKHGTLLVDGNHVGEGDPQQGVGV